MHAVFLSYARTGSRADAQRLRDALAARGIEAFMDERDVPPGDRFPATLAQALRSARAVVLLLSEEYFQRPWCGYELRVALAPYLRDAGGGQAKHVVVGLPAERATLSTVLPHLPPGLADRVWPHCGDSEALADLVTAALQGVECSLGDLLEGLGDDVLGSLLTRGEAPRAESLAAVPGHFGELQSSLEDSFRGRAAELWSLFHLLQVGRLTGAATSCVVAGGAGTGKTQLAAEFVHRYAATHYPGGVVWITATAERETVSPPWSEILRAFDPGASVLGSGGPEVLPELVIAIRERVARAPVLWVIDDFPEVAPGETPRDLSDWCPVLPFVTLVCTARQPTVTGCDKAIDLGELGVDQGVEVLTEAPVRRDALEDTDWRDLAIRVGCLPLVLRQLNAGLALEQIDAATLLESLRASEPVAELDQEFEALKSEVPSGAVRGVAHAFSCSYEALGSGSPLQRAAHLVARLAPIPLPDILLVRVAGRRGLAQLRSRRWLIGDAGGDGDGARVRWHMHRLAASYLRSVSASEAAELGELATALAALLDEPDAVADVPPGRLLPHYVKVLGETGSRSDRDAWPMEEGRRLALAVGTFRFGEREWDELRSWAGYHAESLGADAALTTALREAARRGGTDARWSLLAGIRGMRGSRAAAEVLAELLDDAESRVRAGALAAAVANEHQDRLADPLIGAFLADMDEDALFAVGPLRTDVWDYAENPDPIWAAPKTTGYHLETLAGSDVITRAIEALGARLAESTGPARVPAVDRLALALRVAYTPRPLRFYSAGVKDVVEDRVVGGRLTVQRPQAREPRPAHFAPLLDLIVRSDDDGLARRATRLLATFAAGVNALSNAVHDSLAEEHPERALIVAEAVLDERADFVNAWWWQGLALRDLQREEGALAAFSRVVELEPKFADARVEKVLLALALGQDERALRCAEVLAKQQPQEGLAHRLHASALLNVERWREAAEAASRAIERAPDQAEAWYFRALASQGLHRVDEARRDAARAAELDPDDPRPGELLAELEGGTPET